MEPSVPPQACNGIALPLPFIHMHVSLYARNSVLLQSVCYFMYIVEGFSEQALCFLHYRVVREMWISSRANLKIYFT